MPKAISAHGDGNAKKTARRQVERVLNGLPDSGWRGFLLPPVRSALTDLKGGSDPPGDASTFRPMYLKVLSEGQTLRL